jgi:hypothetical protein
MNKLLRIVIGLLLASALGLLAWQASGPREPVFEDRTLKSWLDHHVASSAASPPYNSPGWKKADQALRSIGTNAIPTLLEMIRAKDPPLVVLKLLQVAARHRWTGINYRYAVTRNEEAEYAFEVLGTNAVGAVSELILGHFEVLDLPASPDLNVSTLCVVANGQIILCARDNHGDRFLDIRRVENEDVK